MFPLNNLASKGLILCPLVMPYGFIELGQHWLDDGLLPAYCQVSNIRRTKCQHLRDSRTVLRQSLPNPLKPDVKSRMKM